jgi:hypothetical protein
MAFRRSSTRQPKPMSDSSASRLPTAFNAAERAYIRRELDRVFSTLPAAADGFLLKVRKTGPNAGEPKLAPPAETLVARGLMRIEPSSPWPRLRFTEQGLRALRDMMSDPKLADPSIYRHIRQELGIEPS